MMHNATDEISSPDSFFRRYLLGESIKNIFIRLTVILSAIILVWCGIMFALIVHTKYHRTKQMLKTASTHHHHLHDSTLSLNRKRSKRNRRCNSSVSSLPSARCCSIQHILSALKRRCGFRSTSAANDNAVQRVPPTTKSNKQAEPPPKNSNSTPSKVQLVVETMSKRPITQNHNFINVGKRISLYQKGQSSSGDQFKNLCTTETNLQPPIESNAKVSSTTQLVEPSSRSPHPSISLTLNELKIDQPTTRRLRKLHQFNTKATLFFHPITRRLSNANASPCLPPSNAILKQQKRKPLLMVSSARELTTATANDWQWQQSSVDEPTTTDASLTSSFKHIPLVMITDTSSSNTNIVELETFEDEHRLVGDIERRLSQELRATYRPRHST